MIDKPLVSVVMPSYNHAEYVGKAIESVLNQTYTNFEFIIADEASQDNSVEIIEQYNDSRIKFTALEKNIGLGASEYVYKQAQGKYIAGIASDDMWKPELLEKYVDFLENNEEYACCFCLPEIINENNQILEDINLSKVFLTGERTKEEWFKQLYMNGNCICAPSMCMRKDIFDKLGVMKYQFRQLQDYEYWLRLLQIGNIYVYPEKLIFYRKHYEGSNKNISAITEESSIRELTERKYIMFDIMENLEDEFFENTFGDEFIMSPEQEGFCIECEKYAVMLKSKVATINAAINFFFKHYDDEKFQYSMENFYYVKRKDFWKLTGVDNDKGLFGESEKEKKYLQIILALQQEINEKNEKIQQLETALRQ